MCACSKILERKYSKEHEWITMDEGIGTIGITDYAQVGIKKVLFIIATL